MSRIQEAILEKDAWFSLQWRRLLSEADDESNLVKYARDELKAAGYMDADGDMYGDMLGKAVIDLIKKFSDQGHSGFSAHVAIALFTRLSKFKPLTPLTGEDDEWNDVSAMMGAEGGPVYQNKRCSSVFKDGDGAYNIDGIVWKDRDGSTFTNKDSSVPVTFPYMVPDRPEVRWSDTKELVV